MSEKVKGWTETHGIIRGQSSVTLIVNSNTGTAHIAAATGDPQTPVWPAHWQPVTGCDLVLTGPWHRPGYYDATDVRNVLDNVLELPPSEISFRRVCSRCERIARDFGIELDPEKVAA